MDQLDELVKSFAEVFRNLQWSYGETTKYMQLTADERAVLHPLEKELYKLIARNVLMRPRKLYHFTGTPGLQGILASGGLRATYWRDLADEHEIRYGMALINEAMQFWRGKLQDTQLQELLGLLYYGFIQHELEQEYYVICFTECSDSERHWNEYGCASSGFRLEFDEFKLQLDTGLPLDVQPVTYSTKEQAILISDIVLKCWSAALDLVRNTPTHRHRVWLPHVMRLLTLHLHWHLSLMKQEHFAWEREWRIIVRGDKPSAETEQTGLKRFTHLPLLRRPHLSPISAIASRRSDDSFSGIVQSHGYDASEVCP